MPNVWMPGAVVDPGKMAGYTRGRNRMQFAVEHFTVGTNSYQIGKDGYFHILFPKQGPPWQFAEIDALTWHAAQWNPYGPGAEFERLGWHEPLTADQLYWGAVWHRFCGEWGIPPVLYAGPRFAAQHWQGFVNHGDLDAQRSDGVSPAEFQAMTVWSDDEESELGAALDTLAGWEQDTRKQVNDNTFQVGINIVNALKAHLDEKLAALPSGPGGELSEEQIRAIVREELDKTRLGA